MTDREKEIRTLWNREDLTQPISLGAAFDAVEWFLGEIERLRSEIRSLEEDCTRIIKQRDALSERNFEMARERDAALERERRLREALETIKSGDHMGCTKDGMGGEGECMECLIEAALAGEGRE